MQEQSAKPWFIYALKDPRDERIRYVGWTSNPKARLRTHRHDAQRGKYHRANWLRSLYSIGLEPQLQILEEGTEPRGWHAAERKWIASFRDQGFDLVNLSDGGEGNPGHKPSKEAVERRAAKQRGRKATPEHKAAISAALKGRDLGNEWRRKLSESAKGRRYSDEVYAKAAAKRRGQKRSEEAKQKTAEALRGRTLSQEVRDKIAESLTGRHLTEEHKEKLRLASKGKKPYEQKGESPIKQIRPDASPPVVSK
jgi:hypothetical protein